VAFAELTQNELFYIIFSNWLSRISFKSNDFWKLSSLNQEKMFILLFYHKLPRWY